MPHTQKTFTVKSLVLCCGFDQLMTCSRSRVLTFCCNRSHCRLCWWLFACHCFQLLSHALIQGIPFGSGGWIDPCLDIRREHQFSACLAFSAQRFLFTSGSVTVQMLRTGRTSKQLWYQPFLHWRWPAPSEATSTWQDGVASQAVRRPEPPSREVVRGPPPNFNHMNAF